MANYVLTLTNTTTKRVTNFEVENNNDEKNIYYNFTINSYELDEGDYLLELKKSQEGDVILKDILRVKITPEYNDSYEKEDSDGYITYDKLN